MVTYRVLPFGGCPLNNPLLALNRRGLVKSIYREMGFRRTPYALSANGAVQLMRFCQRKLVIPDYVRQLCYADPDHVPNEQQSALIDSADLALVEMSTPIEYVYEGFVLNQNRFEERLISPIRKQMGPVVGKLFQKWKSEGLQKQNEERRKTLALELLQVLPDETPHDRQVRDVVAGTHGRWIREAEMFRALEELRAAVDRPMGIVLHNFHYMPDGRPVSWPAEFRDEAVTAIERLKLPLYDPAGLIARYGVKMALMDDFRHYAEDFNTFVGDAYVAFMIGFCATPRSGWTREGLKELAVSGSPGDAAPQIAHALEEVPNDPALIACRGIVEYRNGDFKRAAATFAAVDATAEQPADILSFWMRSSWNIGAFDDVIRLAGRVLEARPRDDAALRLSARAWQRLGNATRGDAFWRRLSDLAPDDAEAPLQVARHALKDGKLGDTERFANMFLQSHPDHGEALFILISTLLDQRNFADVAPLIPRLYASQDAKARAAARRLFDEGEIELCAATLAAMRAQVPDDERLKSLGTIAAREWFAKIERGEVQGIDELKMLDAVRLARPDHSGMRRALAKRCVPLVQELKAAVKERDADAIIGAARAILAIDAEHVDALYAEGRAYLEADRPADAIAPLARCTALEPENAWYWVNLGRAYHRSGELGAAADCNKRVLAYEGAANEPHRATATRALAQVYSALVKLGRKELSERELESAWTHYAKAHEIDPSAENVTATLKSIEHMLLGDLKQAAKTAAADVPERALNYLTKDPDNVPALGLLAGLLTKQKDYTGALPLWEKLAALEPKEARYALQVARSCARLRFRERGIAAAEAALKLDPEMEEARVLREQMVAQRPRERVAAPA